MTATESNQITEQTSKIIQKSTQQVGYNFEIPSWWIPAKTFQNGSNDK